MVFSSLLFLFVFFVVTLAVYFLLPKRFRNLWLFITSIFFYGYGEPVFLILLFASITLNYFAGIWIGKFADKPKEKKRVLIGAVALNLALLGFFKYTGLFVSTLRQLPVFSFLPVPEIALPIGISFYTFQAMSYVIDVYWGNCAPQKNYIIFGTYVSLFPQLIAGPIVRYVDVEKQLLERQENKADFTFGVKLFLLGLGKKVLLANAMGQLWTPIKQMGAQAGFIGCWIGIIAFSLQIYFDFSGYSDMARGLGKMLGFDFVKNFDFPYISRSITEFWRRWHISLGTWFREYVYIPMGGNRVGKLRRVLNLLIVWGLTGLWHGASWNFLLWGLLFGVLLVVEKFYLLEKLEKAPKTIGHIYTLFFVILSWVVFDFTELSQIGNYFVGLFTWQNGLLNNRSAYLTLSYLPLLAVGCLACLPVCRVWYRKLLDTKYGYLWEAGGALIVLILCVASLVSSTYNPFLYFRF